MKQLCELTFFICFTLILYHHLGYPLLLKYFSRKPRVQRGAHLQQNHINTFIFVMPMFNEAGYISQKIANLASLDYPKDKFQLLLLDDGSHDQSFELAQEAARLYPELNCKMIRFTRNRGKVCLFNEVIPTLPDDCILFFSDVSANLTSNTLQRANHFFNDALVGAFCTKYQASHQANAGEVYYWSYQTAIKQAESCLGSPMGYHGSGYAVRKSLWQALPVDTINDDFILPLKVIAKGYLGIYDAQSLSIENEASSEQLTWHRRVRIAYGNIQQVLYLATLLLPRHGKIAWMFFSGKCLRVIIPWLLLLMLVSSFYLSFQQLPLFKLLFWGQLVFYILPMVNYFIKTKITQIISYFVKGHLCSLIAWTHVFKNDFTHHWARAKYVKKTHFIHPLVLVGKWLMDKIGALIGLSVFVLCFPFLAIFIKLSSPGPVFYKQLRVGLGCEKYTQLFYIYKLRTMHINKEIQGARWTAVNDPRVFPFGHFLRKTHLDEMPQFFNILKGDMSLVGPRPERPDFYAYLEKNIPFYEERLYGVKPGLTGAAQVTCQYDRDIEDVKKKLAYDHAYALNLTRPWIWVKTDIEIIIKTIGVAFHKKGQ